MNTITPNSEVPEVVSEEAIAPTTTEERGTEQKETVTTEPIVEDDGVDYRAKFIESSKGAHALLEQKKELERKLAEKEPATGIPQELPNYSTEDSPNLYPGFEELDADAQKNLMAYTDAITNRTIKSVNSDPAIAFSRKMYNENQWEAAFNAATVEFPDLSKAKADFKSKYFNPNNVPNNMSEIMQDLAKIYLFDKAREIGAEQGAEIAQRVQFEEPTGGPKDAPAQRSLEEWNRVAQQNPAEFAKLKTQFDADMASGKLKE